MKFMRLCFAVVAVAASSFTQAAPPAAPDLTAGAAFKGLQFDWDPVAGASWYQLELRAHQVGSFVQQGDDFPASTTSTRITFPLHLFDWTYARYRLGACNSDGCSYSPEVSVSSMRLDAVGYFKTYLTASNHHFGRDVDLSSDGLNFVASAPGETVYAGTTQNVGGAVYVYGKVPGGWERRARLQPTIAPYPGDPSEPEDHEEMHVSISGNGNTVVLGKPQYFHHEFDNDSGEVWTFRYNGSAWVRTRVPRPATGVFGDGVSLSDAGDLLVVGAGPWENRGSVREFYRLVSGAWQHVATISATNPDGRIDMCDGAAFSLDGSTFAQGCSVDKTSTQPARSFIRVFSGTNWQTRTEIPVTMSVPSELGYYLTIGLDIDRAGATIATQVATSSGGSQTRAAEVQVFHRGSSGWTKTATLQPGPWRRPDYRSDFGVHISLSGDASTLAVSDDADNGYGTGVRAAPLNPTAAGTGGAVYIFRQGSGSWKLANVVKTNYKGVVRLPKLSDNGKTLIIGDDADDSRAVGIGGNWRNSDRPGSGAVWLY